jgi:hypothetical protein
MGRLTLYSKACSGRASRRRGEGREADVINVVNVDRKPAAAAAFPAAEQCRLTRALAAGACRTNIRSAIRSPGGALGVHLHPARCPQCVRLEVGPCPVKIAKGCGGRPVIEKALKFRIVSRQAVKPERWDGRGVAKFPVDSVDAIIPKRRLSDALITGLSVRISIYYHFLSCCSALDHSTG